MVEFERPTPQQRIAELRDVAKIMGNSPASIIFNEDGSAKSSIGINRPFPQGLKIPNSQSGTIMSEQIGSEGKSGKRRKVQRPMKENQVRHTENLGGFSGWYNGRYYENGRPSNNRRK